MSRQPLRHVAVPTVAVLVAGVALVAPAALDAQLAAPPLAEVNVSSSAVDFFPNVGHDGAKLTLSGAGKVFAWNFAAGERPSLGAFDPDGNYLADGTYSWELSFTPDAQTRKNLQSAASANRGEAPQAWRALSGSFTIRNGAIASPGLVEPGAGAEGRSAGFSAGPAGGFAVHSRGEALDTDAGGASEAQFRAASGPAAASSYGAGLQAVNPSGGADSDAAVMAGMSAEAPAAAFVQTAVAERPAARKYEPGGKNGRPEREE